MEHVLLSQVVNFVHPNLGRRKWAESHFDCKFTGKVVVLHVVLHVCCTCVAWKFPINCVGHRKTCQDTSLKPRKRKTDTRPDPCSVPKDIPHAVAIESGFFKKNSHLAFLHNGSQLRPRTPNFKVVIQTRCSRPSKKTTILVRTSNSHNFNIDVRGRGGLGA